MSEPDMSHPPAATTMQVMPRLLEAVSRLLRCFIGRRGRPVVPRPRSGLHIAARLVRRRAGEQHRLGHEHTAGVLEALASELDEMAYAEVQ